MAKEKTVYVCNNCGQESPRWVGKCPSCGEWNTYVEQVVRKESGPQRVATGMDPVKSKPIALDAIETKDDPRIDMHVLSPEIFRLMEAPCWGDKFSIIDFYLSACSAPG